MRVHLIFRLTLAVVLAAPTLPALAQAAPAAGANGGIPLSLGGGFSAWDVNWGTGTMEGGTVWADWNLQTTTPAVRGFGLEAEFRDISLGGSTTQPNLRQDTGAVGVKYACPHYKNFRPYVKVLAGVASEDFKWSPGYSHDTRGLVAIGAGADFHAAGPIWVRADYEYQFWEYLISGYSEPNGVTIGFVYNFKGARAH
jgi:opacity protein-like surface antigen